jgi:RNA-directed DNA polymerase
MLYSNSLGRWRALDWKEIESKVFKWQVEIFKAEKNGEIKLVRKTQKILTSSIEAKLLAVRRVTQDNRGKKTAGLDDKKFLKEIERINLATELKIGTKASRLRRVWIPKSGTHEKRPLGIFTMHDRCLQALLKLAIEPEWEAKFEENSYGFRPGRSAHDAIRSISNYVSKKARYVLDADIAKCFDKIDHNKLLDKLGYQGSFRKQILYWLKAGVLDNDEFFETETGTPQGGVISPLLANIAFHGMENMLKNFLEFGSDDIPLKNKNGTKMARKVRRGSIGIIRYADDFVVMHENKTIVLKCKELIIKFLQDIGLELSDKKTRLTHTLHINKDVDTEEQGFDDIIGFDFLGFTIKNFSSTHRSHRNSKKEKLRFKTLIFPSKKASKDHQEKLHQIILHKSQSSTQDNLIKKVNAIISGWSRYFGVSNAYHMNILQKHDHLLFLKLFAWGRKSKKGKAKLVRSLWQKIGPRKWVFSTENTTLVNHIDYASSINHYIKVKGDASPFDGNTQYWANRMSNNPLLTKKEATLIKTQKCVCTICNEYFKEWEVTEIDHIIPKYAGGNNSYTNLQLLHAHCHEKKTAIDLTKFPRPKARGANSRVAVCSESCKHGFE